MLPSYNEWYKAAYYNPNDSTYYNFTNGSNTAPTAVASGTAANTAVYSQPFGQGPADVDQAGGLSPYGVMGLGGNVWEWQESSFVSFPVAIRCQAVVAARVKPPPSGDRWLRPAKPRRRRGARVASFRCVDSSSSSPWPCWLLHGTAEQRPHTRFCRRRSRRLRRGSVAAQHGTTLIQLGGCFPSITHKDLTSISGGRFIRSNWIVAFPTSVSPTMRVPLTDQSKCSSH